MIRPIGEGGFGQVWLGRNRTIGRLCAVKVIPRRHGHPTRAAEREVVSLTVLMENSEIQHSNLLGIHHAGETDDYLFYTMDLADDITGQPPSDDPGYRPATLSLRLESGPLAPENCLIYARQLLAGLAHLHEQGLVHRDVKPANCLFLAGELRLADFGLVTRADQDISRLGTLKYMPPDGCMDVRADVYAAGLVIYEMFTGLPAECFPRLASKAGEMLNEPRLLALNRLVLKACARDPHRRFPDAIRMLAALEKGAEQIKESPLEPALRTARRRLPFWPSLIGGGFALVAVSAAFLSFRQPTPAPPVHVNFITEPYDATIHLDGVLLVDTAGEPYRTPCTVPDFPPTVHRVVFKRDGVEDQDAGWVDFTRTREILVRWEAERQDRQ